MPVGQKGGWQLLAWKAAMGRGAAGADATDEGAGAALGAQVAVLVEKDYQA